MESAATNSSNGGPVEDERALLARLRQGDDGAYEVLVRAYGGRLLALARRLLGNEEDARDAVQETYVAAFRALEDFKGDARLSTWLHRIAVNAALMKLRTRQRKREVPIEELLPRFAEDGRVLQPPREWINRSEWLQESKERREFVRESINVLPESHRTVLFLRDIEGLGTAETAGVLKISQNAVKIRLHRARLALRTLLDRQLGRSGP